MVALHSVSHITAVRFTLPSGSSSAPVRRRFLPVKCVQTNLPFPVETAKYHRELEAAIHVVERACSLCIDMKNSLFSSDGRILEKNDQTPVTVADFGVQALISLELGKLFPSIPLVAEEDSASIRSSNLADYVVDAVTSKINSQDYQLTKDDVLKAIDRGGKDAVSFGAQPATYWVLDPIDGTRGFLKGSECLYVVGLALVDRGEIVLGVMGCPNWPEAASDLQEHEEQTSRPGSIMISHIEHGTWVKRLSHLLNEKSRISDCWIRCFVDGLLTVNEARFCIPDSQTWESLPLSALYTATTDADSIKEKEILLLPTCCGSLCKYMMVASGRASVFILRAKKQTTIKAWDHAVGMICVQEAGGKVTDWEGNQIDLAKDRTARRIIFPWGGVLVTSGNIHGKILEMIPSHSSVI